VLHCGGKSRDGGDSDVRSGTRRRARRRQDDYRQTDVAEHEADEAAGERGEKAPECDRYQEESVQPLEYPV
jgi:hypothetical protein